MNDPIVEILQKADSNVVDKFMAKNQSSIKIIESIEKRQFDYSWLDKIDETIEFLDTIVRNPRRFIMQEEEIVPIGKAKKISQETIRHLATHTNLIQDVDKKGNITPSDVLNIHKEESYDIYENRFVKSLLDNLLTFIYMRKTQTAAGSFSKIERKINYEGETQVDKENIKISLNLETKSHDELVETSPLGLTVEQRISRIELILSDFYKSQFIKELAGALPVRSPIRKTNVILKDQNFKKILELWEFIERYRVSDIEQNDGAKEVTEKYNIIDEMDMAFFLDYAILSNVAKDKKTMKKNINKYYIKKLVDDFIDANEKIDETTFKKILLEEFRRANKEKLKIEKEITKILRASINKYKKKKIELSKLVK